MHPRLLSASLGASWLIASGCAPVPATVTPPAPTVRTSTTTVALHGKNLELHLARTDPAAAHAPLVIYASGDGGWFGAAVDMWRRIADAGYATAGFSSRAFMRIQRPAGAPLNLAHLDEEYQDIIARAETTLGLPADAGVVLTGWSRGAAFSVLVGAEPALRAPLLGVVAIGLDDGEDLAIDESDSDDDQQTTPTVERAWPYDTYALIAGLPFRCAVIQATHDNYFPAAQARDRFGPDTPVRRFYAIDARNHRFTGGKAAFDRALLDALRWIATGAGGAAGLRQAGVPAFPE